MIDVEVRDVTKVFGDVVAVDRASFHVDKGEFFSLLGPSGCGKTTILRMIAGFENPTAGEIRIKGQSMAGVPPFERPTNLVFQKLALFPHMNVFENMAFGLKIKKLSKGEIRKTVGEMVQLVRLSGLETRKIKQLSGGQQQRVAIARALVNQPEVLLLDEPLGPLDLKLREEMILELKRIQREVETTFIYVTHDQGEALTLSDRVAVIKAGKIIQIGTPFEIYEKPKAQFVAEFIGKTNLLKGRYVDGAVEVENLGSISVEHLLEASKGSSVLVCVKPERIIVGRTAMGLDNVFDGTISEGHYQGGLTAYKVTLRDGSSISATALNKEAESILGPHENVKIGWKKSDAVLVTT